MIDAVLTGWLRGERDDAVATFLGGTPGAVDDEPPLGPTGQRAPDAEYDAVVAFLGGPFGSDRAGATGKLSAPDNDTSTEAEDWSDAADAAQADATNEILEALAEGQYDGDEAGFWDDLGSIDAWDRPSWEQPTTCERYVAPVPPKCELAADTSACFPPCIDADPGGCSLDRLPFAEAAGKYQVVVEATPGGGVDQEALDLVQYAWAMLLANLDLVEWCACLVYGEPIQDGPFDWFGVPGSLAECLVDKISGATPRVELVFTTNTPKFGSRNETLTLEWVTGGTILIPMPSPTGGPVAFGSRYLAPWNELSDSSPSAEAACLVADLAATLLHELVHSCATGGTRDEPDGPAGDAPKKCSTSYLIENAFRWTLGARFPCLLTDSASCRYYGCASLFANDDYSYPDDPPDGVAPACR